MVIGLDGHKGICWIIMTESPNFKMSEVESLNFPECNIKAETPPPSCTMETEKCHNNSQVIIMFQNLTDLFFSSSFFV